MTFKLKPVLQRQCCNAWTEFRGCALLGDRSRAASGQEACSARIPLAVQTGLGTHYSLCSSCRY